MKKIIALFILATALIIVLKYSVLAAEKDDRGPLTKITFIHYKKGKEPVKTSGAGKDKPNATTCYKFLASGAKWVKPEDYFVNSAGSNLDQLFVLEAVKKGVSEWETHSGSDILGQGLNGEGLYYNGNIRDNYNVASFSSYSDPNVIAVTTVWGYFGGRPSTRQIVEWDMLFNTYYKWGNADNNHDLMDLLNIATHELGHSAGMGDLYSTSCIEETMYGYSTNGEIDKRTLGPGDIAGIQKLYGN